MRVLVVGGTGMLGSDVVSTFRALGWEVSAPSRAELDVTDPESVVRAISSGDFDWVVNCAAYTAVDRAEQDRDSAFLLNAIAPGYLAQACALSRARLMHLSTDFVFDGSSRKPYTEEDAVHPLGVYGESKLEGESAARSAGAGAVVLRTAWLYGPNGKSFPRTMIRVWREGKPLRVVADQVGTPTYTGDLSRVVADVLVANLPAGVYHAAGSDVTTWHGLAVAAVSAYRATRGLSAGVDITAIRTEDYPTPARRPGYSALSFEKLAALGISPMGSLDAALMEFVSRLED